MTYEELTDELSKIRRHKQNIRLRMNSLPVDANSSGIQQYHTGYYMLLDFKADRIMSEINKRADLIPMEVVYKHLM